MSNWNSVTTILRFVRALLKDRLNTSGRDSFIFQGSANFTLTEDYPSSSTIVVYKNGSVLSSGWSYNTSSNILTISALLATNDIILVCYSYYDKYSDSELTDYLENALGYFSQFGYKKTFALNSARTAVVTVNGVNPNIKECYEFAIITAIVTDPNNIEIKTKDFSLTATEKESKSDLINKAMMQFTTWYGEITVDEVLEEGYNV